MRGLLVRSTWHSRVNWMVFARLQQYEVGQVFASKMQRDRDIKCSNMQWDGNLQQYAAGELFAAICSGIGICSNMQRDRDLQRYAVG